MIRLIVVLICLPFSFAVFGNSQQTPTDSLRIIQFQLEIDSLKSASPKGNLSKIIAVRKNLSALYQKQKNYEAAITQQVLLYNNFYALDEFDEAEKSLNKGFEITEYFDTDSSYAYTNLIVNQGFHLRNIGVNGKSIEYMETAFSRLLNVHKETILSQRLFMKTMASIYQSRSDYFKAIDLLESFISNANDAGKTDTIAKIDFHHRLGYLYARVGDYDNSLDQKKLILNITNNNELNESNEMKFYSYAYASEYYSNFYSGSYQAALEAWKKNCEYWEASGRKLRYYHYSTFGDNYAKIGAHKESIQSFTKAIELYESRKTKNVRTFSELYSKRAKSYYAMGEKDNFSLDLQKALEVIDYQEMDKGQFRLYLKNNAFSNYNIELMSSQLTALRDEYESSATDERNSKKAEELFERFREGSRFLTSNLTDEFSRFGMLNVISQEFEKHINFLVEIIQESSSKELIKDLYAIIEENSASIIRENIDQKIYKNLSVDEDVLAQENSLNKEIAEYNNLIYKEQKKDSLSKKLIDYKNNLIKLENEYARFQTKIEQGYPQYYKLKYDNEIVSLNEIQSSLSPNEGIIQYYLTDKYLLAFLISENDIQLFQLEGKENLQEQILRYQQLISTPPSISDFEAGLANFNELSNDLYNTLLKDIDKSLNSTISNIIIIPHLYQSYIPFETLRKVSSNENSFKSENFMLHKYNISYAYSGKLWLYQNEKQKRNNGSCLAFAPSYNSPASTQRNLGSLECNDEEVEAISTMWKGKSIIGKDASKSQFEQAEHYQILHIAAHATIDESNSDFNRIQFEDDYLSFHELYNYKSNAELAVLSACNSGMGQMKTGEGVISLGKGFLAMGVKSIVTTLWSINDCATSKLMALFYQNLKEGDTKTQALCEAKKSYIKQASNLESHPYYWAGFKLIGNSKPLQVKAFSMLHYALISVLLLCAAFFFFRKKSSKA